MDIATRYRTLDQITEEYLRDRPDETDAFLQEVFEDYAHDRNIALLLSFLRIFARIRGITAIADVTGLSRKGVQKALSEEGNPHFKSIVSILRAMGYKLLPQRE